MPATRETVLESANRSGAAQPLRRRRVPPAPPGPRHRAVLNALLIFAIVVLAVDGLVGEKGLIETMQARRQYRQIEASLERLQQENARLRETMRLLRDDPATIEGVAREDLGLIRPGETLFIIRDAKPVR